MPATLVQSVNGTSANITNPATATFSSNRTVGNTIILYAANDSGTANYLTSVTATGVTWTRRASVASGGADHEIWEGKVTSASNSAITFGFSQASATRIDWQAEEWSGLDATQAYSSITTAVTGTTASASTVITSNSTGTLPQADCLITGHGSMKKSTTGGTASSFTVGSGYSDLLQTGALTDSYLYTATESKTVAATTATTASFTVSPTGITYAVFAVVWKGVGSTDYTASPSDNVGITDTATADQTNDRQATDTVGITDTATALISLAAGVPVEPIGITDNATAVTAFTRTPADPVGITDTTTLLQTNFETFADPVAITDSVALDRVPPAAADPVGITDSVEAVIDTTPQPTAAPITDGSIPVPLSVRLKTATADVLLIEEVRDISFRSVVPGGFASATITLDRQPWVPVPEVQVYGRMYIYDTRDGSTVWEGIVEDPGKSVSSDGFAWEVTAVGPSAHARDETFASAWIDSSVESFEKFGGSKPSTTVTQFTDASDRDGIKVAFPGGTAAASPQYVSARTLTVYNAGGKLGSIFVTLYSSDVSPTWEARVYTYPSASLIASNTITTGTNSYFGETGSDFPASDTMLHVRMDRTGASAAPADEVWTFFYGIVIRSTMVDEEGNPLTDYSDPYVTSSQVIQDVIGRHLPLYDPLDAYIEETFDQLTQLSYDSTTAYDVFNDLLGQLGAYYWAAWETVERSGKWRFEFRPWSTDVRYEAGIDDDWSSPGSAADLYNECLVTWKDARGREQVTKVTASVQVLTDAGRKRTARIDLGTEIGSAAAATAAGTAFLAEHNLPSRNGRLVIAKPIVDYVRGQLVDPWQIRPGGLIRLRGITPKYDALTPNGRDGTSVFRIVATNFRAEDGSVELELDSDSYSTTQAIARLQKQRSRR